MRYRQEYDDFWSTGIWVGLRLFFLPVAIFCAFYFLGDAGSRALDAKMSHISGSVSRALHQIDGGLGGQGFSRSHTISAPGAKWLRP